MSSSLPTAANGRKYLHTIQKHQPPTSSTTPADFTRLVIDNSIHTAGFAEKGREDVTIDGQKPTILSYRLGTNATDPTLNEVSLVHAGYAYVLVGTQPATPNDAIAKQLHDATVSFLPQDTVVSTAPLSPLPSSSNR